MKFLTTLVQETDRTLHNTVTKYETITLTIKMTSSGDTSRFTSNELITIVMDRLREVESNNIEYMTPLEYIKHKHNGEVPYKYGSNECAKLMEEYADYKIKQSMLSTDDRCQCGNKDWKRYYKASDRIICGSCNRPIAS
jgi:hypothetical protein